MGYLQAMAIATAATFLKENRPSLSQPVSQVPSSSSYFFLFLLHIK
jgi:hypothetical protein